MARPNKYAKIENVKAKQFEAIALYVSNLYSWEKISKILNIHSNTLYAWRVKDKEFIKELERQHEIHLKEVGGKNTSLLNHAYAILAKIGDDPKVDPEVRIKSAAALIEAVYKNMELQSDIYLRREIDTLRASIEASESLLSGQSMEETKLLN